MRTDLNQVPEGWGDEPRIHLPENVLEFLHQRPKPPSFNGYKCERRPAHIIVTIDIHPGVTPMFLSCRHNHCEGQSVSFGYPNNGEGPVPKKFWNYPAWLWYRPSMGEFLNLTPGMSDQVMSGGLAIKSADMTFAEWYDEEARRNAQDAKG